MLFVLFKAETGHHVLMSRSFCQLQALGFALPTSRLRRHRAPSSLVDNPAGDRKA